MSIVDKFPIREHVIRGDQVIKETSPYESRPHVGVLLDRSNTRVDWLDIAYGGGSQVDVALNVTTDNKSTVFDKVSIREGEGHVFGRDAYPWIHDTVSREHVEVRSVRIIGQYAMRTGVVVTDLNSTNGTSIWVPSDPGDKKWHREEQTPFEEHRAEEGDATNPALLEVDALETKYGAEFSKLELVDYGILSTIIKSHPEALSSRKEKLKIIALIHPDRNITGNDARSHELYILALRVLNITL